MSVADTILQQLGGQRFIAMTGSNHFVSDKNTLRMHLAKNMSKANRLDITLEFDDTYTMRFYKYTPSRLVTNHKTQTCKFSEEKVAEIAKFTGVYFDSLQEIFTQVTGMYTHF